MGEVIQLVHGEGGKHTQDLIHNIFYENFNNEILLKDCDSALVNLSSNKIAFTTDSFVVNPIFFRGGDIGKLSICGTVNDLTACGAKPLYLSAGFIIEEGFRIEELKSIVKSMREACESADVKIITGDTKVVPRGKGDKIFINTAGIGIRSEYKVKEIKNKDKVIITGGIGEHGTAIAVDRYNLKIKGNIKSDCQPLNYILNFLEKYYNYIKFMRDPTRGGIGEVLNEISKQCGKGIHLIQSKIPIRGEVEAINDMLGINPLYLASEGRMVIISDEKVADDIVDTLIKKCNCNACIIGEVTEENKFVFIENEFGGKRILGGLDAQILPRIC